MKTETFRWFVLAQLILSVFCTGGVYAWSVFVKPLCSLHNWSITEVTFAYSLLLFMVAFFGILGGRLLDKYGPKYLMLTAGILFGLGWFLVGYAHSIWQLYLFLGIIAGIGDSLLYGNSVTTACRWFPERKGLATGLVVGAAGLAPLILAPLANWVLTKYGVLNAFHFFGLLFFVLRCSTFWIVDNPPAGWQPEGWDPETVTASGTSGAIDLGTAQMLKKSRFWLLYFAYLCGCCSGLLLTSQASGLGQEIAHLTPAAAASIVGIMALMNFIGRFSMGTLSDKIGRYRTLMIAFIITAVTMAVFGRAHSFYPFIVVLSVVAICFGSLLATYPGITGETFGLRLMGSNYGIMFTAYGIAAIVGPMMAAYFKQTTGSYNIAFVIAACLALTAFVLVYIANTMRKREHQLTEAVQNASI